MPYPVEPTTHVSAPIVRVELVNPPIVVPLEKATPELYENISELLQR